MRKIVVVSTIAAVLLAAVPSFAFIDAEVFGGYNMAGKIEADGQKFDVDGWNYGARAHLTNSLILMNMGFGAFLQKTPLEFSVSSQDYKFTRTNTGLDMYAGLNLLMLNPYARVGLSFFEYVSDKGGTTNSNEWKYFNYYYAGVGLGFSLPMPVVRIMVFGEYLYNKRFKGGNDIVYHTINFGASIGI